MIDVSEESRIFSLSLTFSPQKKLINESFPNIQGIASFGEQVLKNEHYDLVATAANGYKFSVQNDWKLLRACSRECCVVETMNV